MPRTSALHASLAHILNTQKPITNNFAGLHNHFNYASTGVEDEIFRAEADEEDEAAEGD